MISRKSVGHRWSEEENCINGTRSIKLGEEERADRGGIMGRDN